MAIYGGLLDSLAKLKFATRYCSWRIGSSLTPHGEGITGHDLREFAKSLKSGNDAVRLHRDANDINYSENVKSEVEEILGESWSYLTVIQQMLIGDNRHGVTLQELHSRFANLDCLIENTKQTIVAEINQYVFDETKQSD